MVSFEGCEDFFLSRSHGHMIVNITTSSTDPIMIGLSINAITGNLFIYYKYLIVKKIKLSKKETEKTKSISPTKSKASFFFKGKNKNQVSLLSNCTYSVNLYSH